MDGSEVSHPDFCSELRQKTKAIHDKSDKLINLKLAVVLTDMKLWGDVLLDFYHVFLTIEQCLYQYQDTVVGVLHMPQMYRAQAFEKDLEFYLGSQWPALTKPSEAAKSYCDRIVAAAGEDPTLLVAYTHSMYLGLLAGGQIIKRIMKKTLGLSDENGLAIFEFEDISRSEVKKSLMDTINTMELTRDQKDRIIIEKKRCFQMNNAIAENVKLKPSSFKRLLMIGSFVLLFCLLMINLLVNVLT